MPDPLAVDDVETALRALRELPDQLDAADTRLRADVYRSARHHARLPT